jgi:hypothetical protein
VGFPLRSLAAFGASFGAVSILCDWVRIYVAGSYEVKWTPGLSFAVGTVSAFLFFIPAAMLGFAIGSYLVNTNRDPWVRSLFGGALLGAVFFGATLLTLHTESLFLAHTMVWGTLLAGGGIVGASARRTAREPAV